ncbi:PREDICTED: quinone oxidoreductase-like protein 2 isoform X3 [Polistes canadensis]|uniref:quinone oxidoreductase-like protein 2 isoform X3 n=1 Tax=Polistes canadensis TaxID=91411 RepID=UPI000718C365|nr:PREDICTED: quinone oxidoreductase-like protein 2 isoform X3 [Polistes canadensis]
MSVTIRRMFITHVSGIYWKNLRKQSIRLISNETPTKERSPNDSFETNIPASEPAKFQIASLNKFDNSLIIQNVESFKAAQPNEVVIDVHYCTINPSDVLLSKNLYTYEPKLPITLGYELVGELVYIGKNAQDKGYKIGDKVIALNKERYGGFAEQCIAEVGDIWKIPSNLRSVDAVCLLNDYMSALVALERVVTIDENDIILVNVGLSGIGLAAADLATNVFRSQVLGICINNEDASLIRNRGVFASLEYNEKKLLKRIEQIAGDKNIKAFLDGDGGEYFKKILKCLSHEGRVVIAGAAATKMDAQTGIEDGSFTITGFNLDEYRRKEPESYRQAGEEVLEFFEEGLIIPFHSMIFGLHKINDALRFSSEGRTSAKVIIDIKDKERVDVVKISE